MTDSTQEQPFNEVNIEKLKDFGVYKKSRND